MTKYYIKSSKHDIKFANKEKQSNLNLFIDEYRRVMQEVVDRIWSDGYEWEYKGEKRYFDVTQNQLYFPNFIDYNKFDINTNLSARALSSLVTQVTAIIKSAVEKQRKRLYTLNKKREEGIPRNKLKPLIKKIKQNIPQKPNCSNINIEASSKCIDWQDTDDGEFAGFLRLRCIDKNKTQIRIPIIEHKHYKSLAKKGTRMNSFLISKERINVRWKIEKPELRKDGEVLGCDQGMKEVLTCSTGSVTPKFCPHGHSLESILRKLSTKKKGSKSFKRSQKHRNNFINWSINQLNFSKTKEVRLEKIWKIGYKNRTSRLMSHWTNTLIRDKIESKCEEEGIRLIHQSSTYRSQRCSNCGVVRKANRKGKIYKCKHCLHEMDADLNAAKNHTLDLPEIPYTLCKSRKNLKDGFYWNEYGFFDYSTGRSLESLPPIEDKEIEQ